MVELGRSGDRLSRSGEGGLSGITDTQTQHTMAKPNQSKIHHHGKTKSKQNKATNTTIPIKKITAKNHNANVTAKKKSQNDLRKSEGDLRGLGGGEVREIWRCGCGARRRQI